MKVLILHNRYRPSAPSGENVVVDQESAALRDDGHDVRLLQRHSAEISGWSPARRATLPVQVLWSGQSRRDVAQTLREFSPDVVHVHNTFPLLTPSVLHACHEVGVPVVTTLHNYKASCAAGTLFRDGQVCHECLGGSARPALRHGCYRGSTAATAPVVLGSWLHAGAWRTMVAAYIFISQAQRELLAPAGLSTGRSFVKHNFVPEPPAPTEVTASTPQVAYVGRLDAAKGVRFLMRAWDHFRAVRPGSALQLVVAGGGELEEDVRRWAEQHGSVRFVGQVPRDEASRLLAGSRAAVIPSQWEETFGMVAVEAMAAGTAPLASAHGSFPELIRPGIDGALFPPTDVPALAAQLGDVEDHPERWDGYGRQARRTYQERFTAGESLAQLLSIYRFAIEHPTGPARPVAARVAAAAGAATGEVRGPATKTPAGQSVRAERRRTV